jgi:hypothetical protein
MERAFHEAINKRDFRIKWRKFLQALLLLSKDLYKLPKITNINVVKYLLLNRLGQNLDINRILIPPKNRKDDVLGDIKIIRHREYTPTPKKSTKIVSNSAETKGTYNPDSIKWADVANQSMIFVNGKWIGSIERPKPDPTNLEKLT